MNKELFKESERYMPGGVNSPVRAYKGLDITPPIIKEGKGAYIFDEEGKKYTDYIGAWGPAVLGQADDDIVNAIKLTADKGISFGSPTRLELDMARHICSTIDSVDMIRMVNSGTEATMSAARLARGYTDRKKIIKFEGNYHGHYDGFLISAGSGVLTEGIPGSKGVPEEIISNTILARYNDIESIEQVFKTHGEEIAGVIIEPIAGNMGVIPAKEDFLLRLKELCMEYNSVLIFDEVMTGFRVSYKGAQGLYNIEPDLTTFAKVMGGGLPSGAYGGKRKIMEKLSPIGEVYQAGTMSGNPIVMAAGYTALKKLFDNPEYYDYLENLGRRLENGINEISKEKGIPTVINRVGSMMTIFYNELEKVETYEDALKSDIDMYNSVFKYMLNKGIYIAPSQFEGLFLSVKHSNEDIDRFLEIFRKY
ncbi:MAG: glutamate-1-semialdehyde 2,1-aminomutase [Andreesenia angusta]|nr:glutamate-1-semialdehyde 2,1-aminomutase [Andreesenia angusta]